MYTHVTFACGAMCNRERAEERGYCAHVHAVIVCSSPCQVPHYRREQIVFEVHPPSLTLTITNDSLTVEVYTVLHLCAMPLL